MGAWMQHDLKEDTSESTAPPTTSFQMNKIDEGKAWTLMWLLHHKREDTPPTDATKLPAH